MTAISRNLRTLKEQRDTTQSAIAAVAGASVGAVSKWFSGEKTPRAKYLDAIAAYYLVSMDDLTSENHGLYAKAHGLESAPAGATAVTASARRTVPVRVLGTTYASFPDDPTEYEGEAVLYEDMASMHPNCYALTVNGRCMDKVFTPEDHIFVDPDMQARDGSIAVMLVNGKSEVRRVKMGNGSMMLVSESHDPQPDIYLRDGDSAICQGVVFWWQARSESS